MEGKFFKKSAGRERRGRGTGKEMDRVWHKIRTEQ